LRETVPRKSDLEGIYQGGKGFEKDVGKIGRVKWVRDR
jgi:hypothetical protein